MDAKVVIVGSGEAGRRCDTPVIITRHGEIV